MTYLKTTLIATALTAATSSLAFAGEDMDKDAKVMQKTNVTTSSPMTDVLDNSDTRIVTKANDTIGEVLQADGQPDTQSDYELLTHDGDMLTKTEAKMMDSDHLIANNAIVVPSSSGAITTVNCPIGTTAQVDMTCMVTGNYDLETSEALRKQELPSDTQVLGAVSYDFTRDSEMKPQDWKAEAKDTDVKWSAETPAVAYDTTLEYKGTLRPDTIVTSNVD